MCVRVYNIIYITNVVSIHYTPQCTFTRHCTEQLYKQRYTKICSIIQQVFIISNSINNIIISRLSLFKLIRARMHLHYGGITNTCHTVTHSVDRPNDSTIHADIYFNKHIRLLIIFLVAAHGWYTIQWF